MKLLFKQRFFSWFDSYDIYNEEGDTVYTVKGAPSWGHRLIVCDALGNEIGTVREKVLSWLPKFEMFLGDRYIGRISKWTEISLNGITASRIPAVSPSLRFLKSFGI